jgi:NAD(P)H-hydrate repair Nnr-like enzyme with NAD(P)H-hydrate dehydratase domain
MTQRWVAGHLPQRPERAHKGDFGRLLVVAG